MAMNKTERAEFERLQAAATPMFPAYPCPTPLTAAQIEALPDVMVPNKWNKASQVAVKAVWFANVYSGYEGRSDVVNRGSVGNGGCNRRAVADTDSQFRQSPTGEPVFATEIEALQYVRHKVAERVADKLARLDAVISHATKDAK